MNDLTKKPGAKTEYNQDQLLELQRCQDDPIYFIEKFVKVQHPTKGSLPLTLYPFQRKLVEAFHNHVKVCALTARQMGKNLSLDTPILTPTGFLPLADLKVGDHIYGPNGLPTRIKHLTPVATDRPCYSFDFIHGERIVADAEHLWKVSVPLRRGKEERIVTTLELIALHEKASSGGQSIHIDVSSAIEFPETAITVDPYLYGLWLGDGTRMNGKITCSTQDSDHYIEQSTARGYPAHFRNRSNRPECGDVDLGRAFTSRIKILQGISAMKYARKIIPDELIFTSVENRLSLLQGLMDTDGTIEKNGTARFYQSDKDFCERVRILLSSLGIKTTLREKKTTHKICYILTFATSQKVCLLPRKLKRIQNLKNHPKNTRFYIRKIEPTASVPVRCVEVEHESHLFLAGKTLVPTHNCVAFDTKVKVDRRLKNIGDLLDVSLKTKFIDCLERRLLDLARKRS